MRPTWMRREWPSPSDFSAAVQDPRRCFSDPELQRGAVACTPLGLPFGISGNYAVVYQVRCDPKVYAVRCFTRPPDRQRDRYIALSQVLRRARPSALVEFTYLEEGINIGDTWYPLVRMEWADGRQLHQYVEDHLGQGQVLRQLAAQWRAVMRELRAARLAHGDLQHGNVLVDDDGKVRLVDYDAVFVPGPALPAPSEVGHPNYQHPERVRRGYHGANVDAFAALVIYLSLLATSVDPELWVYHQGDNLVFSASDFESPGETAVWKRLRSNPDGEVRRLAETLAEHCRWPVASVPDLETTLERWSFGERVCPHCGQKNATDDVYCQRCAARLTEDVICTVCHSTAPCGARYCPSCGAKL